MNIKAVAPRKVNGKPADVREHCGTLTLKAECTEDAAWLSAIYMSIVHGEKMPGRCPTGMEQVGDEH